jgi:hypothetical protein
MPPDVAPPDLLGRPLAPPLGTALAGLLDRTSALAFPGALGMASALVSPLLVVMTRALIRSLGAWLHEETKMRAVLTAALVIAAIGLSTTSPTAAPTGVAVGRNAPSFTQLVQDNHYGSYTTGFGLGYSQNYIPACPINYHYSCWSDPYGYRHCGCLLNDRH